jgi:hypothetical protein
MGNMAQKSFPIILLALGTLLQVTPAPLRALSLESGGLVPVSIPTGSESLTMLQEANLDGIGVPESLSLASGILTIFSGNMIDWQSPSDWNIIQAAIADLNHDGQPEVVLLLWRPFKTWPVDQWLPNGGRIADFHDANGQSCHIILVGWRSNGYRELWAGSAMADPISAFAAADLNGDNIQELVALEGRYTDSRSAPARILKVWKWNGFGFAVVSSLDGVFDKMTLVQAIDGHVVILVP